MHRIARTVALAALALIVAVAAVAVDPEDLHRVTFANNTGYDIYYLFFSPSDSEHWGADILGTTRRLDDGEELGFFISYPGSSSEFNLMAIDEDNDAYFIHDYELSSARDEVIEITMDDFDGAYDMPELAEVKLTNVSGYDMWYVFFSPGDSQVWGMDMLDERTILSDGATLSLYVPVSGKDVRYDVQSLDEDEDSYQFWVQVSNRSDEFEFEIDLSFLQ